MGSPAVRVVAFGAGIVAGLGFLGAASTAEPAADPPGNNGTIKVDGVPFDLGDPNNEPHVDCVFEVDFYGFDEGQLSATVTFVAHPPTGGPVPLIEDPVFIGEDGNEGGGSFEGLDAHREYDLTTYLAAVEPHDQQGWHVSLTIEADGAQGADVKHKVYWVSGCELVSPTTGTTATTLGGVTTSTVAGAVLGVTVTQPPTEVAGVTVERAPEALARTGAPIGALVGLGAALVAMGAAARHGARSRR